MHIRNACMMDKDEIYNLVCDAFDASFDQEVFERILWENINNTFAYYIVAVEHERVIGFASLSIEKALHCLGSFGKLQEFAVAQSSEKEMVANALMEAMMRKAAQLNCLFIEVRIQKVDILNELQVLQDHESLSQQVYHISL